MDTSRRISAAAVHSVRHVMRVVLVMAAKRQLEFVGRNVLEHSRRHLEQETSNMKVELLSASRKIFNTFSRLVLQC